MYVQEPYLDMRGSKTVRQLRLMYLPQLRKRVVWDSREKEDVYQGDGKNICRAKQRQWENFVLQAPSPLSPSQLAHFLCSYP